MQSDFTDDVAGSASTGTRWLRLVAHRQHHHRIRVGRRHDLAEDRHGDAEEPAGHRRDRLLRLVRARRCSSRAAWAARRSAGAPTGASATFDSVAARSGRARGRGEVDPVDADPDEPPGGQASRRGRRHRRRSDRERRHFTVTGTGKVGPKAPDDDIVEVALIGVIAGLMALIAVGALFATVRVPPGHDPHDVRGHAPARAGARRQGDRPRRRSRSSSAWPASWRRSCSRCRCCRSTVCAPPAFPTPSLTDGPVLRALLLTAAFMTGVTLSASRVGMLLRRSAAAITLRSCWCPAAHRRHGPAGHVAALAHVHHARRRAGHPAGQATDRHAGRALGDDRALGRASAWSPRTRPSASGSPGGSCAGATHERPGPRVRAEWTKLRTLPSTGWLLLLAVGLDDRARPRHHQLAGLDDCGAPCVDRHGQAQPGRRTPRAGRRCDPRRSWR